MKGNFQKIYENKSIPISELLIRTLILHLAEDGFPQGKHNELFPFLSDGVRELEEHPNFRRRGLVDFAPIYSKERDLWICYSFNEDKAHRIAFYNANQCRNLIIVFCNPTYTRHHRCLYPNTDIISIYQFANNISSEIRKKYENQIRFLQNHLNHQDDLSADKLLKEIFNPTREVYEIRKSELMEALGVMKILPNNDQDFFHSLCAVNLINAFLSRQRENKQLKDKKHDIFRNMYYFKTYLSDILTERIKSNNLSVPIYITRDMVMIEIDSFQFSFHNVPLNQTLVDFQASPHNKEIIWSKKKTTTNCSIAIKLFTCN